VLLQSRLKDDQVHQVDRVALEHNMPRRTSATERDDAMPSFD